MPGQRYTMQFDGRGNARQYIAELEGAVNSLSAQVQKLNSQLHGAHGNSEKLGEVARNTKATAIAELGEQFERTSEKFDAFAEGILEKGKEITKEFINTAAEFQDIRSGLDFAFGPDAQHMYDKTLVESQHLVFTFKQATDIVNRLGQVGVNVFGGMGDEIEKFKPKTGPMIGSLDVIQDVLAGTGLAFSDTNRLIRGMEGAMAGNFREFKMGLNMSHERIEAIKKAMAGATSQQDKWNKLNQALASIYGGASAMRMDNYSFALQQILDKWEQLKGMIGGAAMKSITDGMKDFYTSLQHILEDKEAMEALKDAFSMVGKVIGFVLKAAAKGVDFFHQIIKTAPWLPKLAIGLLTAAVAGSLLMGTLFAIAAAVAVAAAGFLTIGLEATLAGIAVAVLLLPVTLALAAAFGLVALLAYAVFKNIVKGGEDGFTVFQKIQTVLTAVGELLSSYNGMTGKLSEGTANTLKKMGLLGFVTDLFKIYHRVRTFISNFIDTVSEIADKLAPVILPMLAEMKAAFFELLETFGFVDAKTKASASSTKDWAQAGKDLAEAVITVVRWMVQLIRFGVYIVRMANYFGLVGAAIVYVKIIAAALVVVLGLAAVAALAIATPFIIVGALIHGLIVKVKQLIAAFKEGGGGFMGFAKTFMAKPGESAFSSTLRNMTGFGGGEDSGLGMPTMGGNEAATAQNGLGRAAQEQMLNRIPGLMGAPPVQPPGQTAPAGGAAAGAERTAAAVQEGNGIMSQVLAAIQGLNLDVYLDGEKVGGSLKKSGVKTGGVE